MTTQSFLKNVIEKIITVAHPSKIILFGSYARNEMSQGSDLDLLIIEPVLENKGMEMVRLRNAIGNVGMGVDILVCTEKEIDEWGHLPGTALYSALKEGKVIYESL